MGSAEPNHWSGDHDHRRRPAQEAARSRTRGHQDRGQREEPWQDPGSLPGGSRQRAREPAEAVKRPYTKTGDDGTTGLFGGRRVRKDDSQIEALGTLDELIAYLGLARAHTLGTEIKACQHVLYEVMSTVSGAQDTIDPLHIAELFLYFVRPPYAIVRNFDSRVAVTNCDG